MNQTIKVLESHTSIRKFNDTPIPEEQEKAIIHAAMRAATAGNMMLYSIIKIKSKERLEALAKSCDDQPFIENASLALLFVADSSKWHDYFLLRNIPEAFPSYDGPVISDFMLGVQDAMIAAQNAVIAAESLGIGTCYIGDIMEHYEHHKAFFNLPEYSMPVTLVVFGNYDTQPAPRHRFDEAFVVFDETYKKLSSEEIAQMFETNEKGNPDFAHKFYKRKMDAPFFKEMIRSINLYIKEWRG